MGNELIMDYFDLGGFEEYSSKMGKTYDTKDPATDWWKDTKTKLEYLVGVLRIHLTENISINYTEKPNARAGRGKPFILKNYVITGFSPDGKFPDNGELFIKLAFHNLSTNPVFDIEMDQNQNSSIKPFDKIINQLRESSRKSIPINEDFPLNWDALVDEIQDHVSELITKYRNLIKNDKPVKQEQVMIYPLNTILYGPPGTGKTYSTIDESLKILGEDLTVFVRKGMKKKFSEFQKEQRVFFTTFHQNMAYEDFIEGIKPVEPHDDDEYLEYEVQDGLFMKACIEATFNYLQSNFQQDKVIEKLLDFNALFDQLFERVSNTGSLKIKTKSGGQVTAVITSQGNFSINHQGSDKPYTVSRDRLSKIYELFPNPDEISNVQNAFSNAIGGCNSTAYWSVLNAIADIRDKEDKGEVVEKTSPKDLSYEDKRKIVQNYWDKKDCTVLDNDQSLPYVFIIDEINRGNVAQIFGELITLIEDDKRMGKKEVIYAELPYSKHSFSIPPNLYIIGTMNTADRSVEALDTALRRRFSFEHMEPQEDMLMEDLDDTGINLKELLKTLNNRLRILKDNDHTIGHAWFWDVKNVDQLKKLFANKILPLLQEYFYNDYEKLGLVLGDSFFELPHKRVAGNEFAVFTGSNGLSSQYRNKYIYKLKDASELEIDDFLSLTHFIPVNED